MGRNPMQDDLMIKQIKQLAVMEANNCSREEKLKDIFGIDVKTGDPRDIHNADCTMSRWRKTPQFETAWKEEQRSWDFSDYSLARSVFRKAMKQDKDQWLAVNSAVNALSQANKRLFRDEDNAVTIKFEGSMPEIGSPDDNA